MQLCNVPLVLFGLLCFGLVSTAPAPNSPWHLRSRQEGGGYYGQPSNGDGSVYPPSSGTGGFLSPTATSGYPSATGTGGYSSPSGTGGYPSATGTGGYASPTGTSYPTPTGGYSEEPYHYKGVKLGH
ncbi:hypothetical protein HI914_03865 [Erysiphe necator]|uniref:Uncharacterized protein n=1 Tax=Uncinula necator TaxID=52586 RepID=A0A0B1P5M9_UNCNE|nr:hypothetical protein HI914_03865 [Erysiphe necator]KHJ33997.1 hypothetical protein EV44_g0152 [Erysiphe necator]